MQVLGVCNGEVMKGGPYGYAWPTIEFSNVTQPFSPDSIMGQAGTLCRMASLGAIMAKRAHGCE
jgi:hypothetical protein